MKILGRNKKEVVALNIKENRNGTRSYSISGYTMQPLVHFIQKVNNMEWDERRVFLGIPKEFTKHNKHMIKSKILERYKQYNLDMQDVTQTERRVNLNHQGESFNLSREQIDMLNNILLLSGYQLPEALEMLVEKGLSYFTEINVDEENFSYPEDLAEYVVYTGVAEKYRGCIGIIIEERDNVAPHKVRFIKKFNQNGNIMLKWCKECNLDYFKPRDEKEDVSNNNG